MMIVWKIREKIVRAVLCYSVYFSSAQWYAHIYEQFLYLPVGLGLLLGLLFICFFECFSVLINAILFCAFVVLDLVFNYRPIAAL